jgi:predicted kinase
MWTLTDNINPENLFLQFDWIRDMKQVPQDPKHHAEGNVFIHTMMVLNALISLEEYNALSKEEQSIMIAAVLLHDVEKRSTTEIRSDGSIISPGHSRKGEKTARYLLYTEYSAPFATREKICALVRHHGLPIWIFEKPDPLKALLRASLQIPMKLLYLIAKADMLGRICEDQQEMLDRVELFAEYCKENNCWDQPYPFASDYGRFLYFYKEENSPDYLPFEDTKSTVVLISGLPGSGKDTFIQKNYQDWPMISLDAFRREFKLDPNEPSDTSKAVTMAKEQAKVYLREGVNFTWNATNLVRDIRSQLIELFATYKAKVVIEYVEMPWEVVQHQNRNREHVVPDKIMKKMVSRWEVPTSDEAHEMRYNVK